MYLLPLLAAQFGGHAGRAANRFYGNAMPCVPTARGSRDVSRRSPHCPWADNGALRLPARMFDTTRHCSVFRKRRNRRQSGLSLAWRNG